MTTWACPACGTIYQTTVRMPVTGPLHSCRNRGCAGRPEPRR